MNLTPLYPKYVETWDVTVVLKFLANLHPPSKLTLRANSKTSYAC